MILFAAATLIAAGTYAQTQKTNRTHTRTHDRSDLTNDAQNTNKTGKATHENDMDRNNTNLNTVTPNPNSTNTNGIDNRTDTGRSTYHPK